MVDDMLFGRRLEKDDITRLLAGIDAAEVTDFHTLRPEESREFVYAAKAYLGITDGRVNLYGITAEGEVVQAFGNDHRILRAYQEHARKGECSADRCYRR